MGTITLVTGGVRSGKSGWALRRGNQAGGTPKVFVATAQVLDDEMRARATQHRHERGAAWRTVEEPLNLADVVRALDNGAVAIIDCVTVWLGNVWHVHGDSDHTLKTHIDTLCDALRAWARTRQGEIIIVTNEVGWGIVPPEAAVRRYRDWAGRLNQELGALADTVYLSVAGIAVPLKGDSNRDQRPNNSSTTDTTNRGRTT